MHGPDYRIGAKALGGLNTVYVEHLPTIKHRQVHRLVQVPVQITDVVPRDAADLHILLGALPQLKQAPSLPENLAFWVA